MRFLWPLLLLLLCPTILLAQSGIITGKVTRKDKTPIANANVFLSNATFGTATAEDGTFTIRGIKPGQYELIVSIIGYEDYSQTVLVNNNTTKVDVTLSPANTMLHEVVITTNANWKKNYEMFKTDFLGTSANAKQCKILNPRVLNFIYHKSKKTLDAFTYEFIEIENMALGYKVKFLLKDFKSDHINNIISWEGKILYSEIKASKAQESKWEDKRRDIYFGSSMHFFRSLEKNRLDSDGFVMMQLKRQPNPERASDEVIQKKFEKFNGVNRDSANHWVDVNNMHKYIEHLFRTPFQPAEVLKNTQQPGIFAITFPDCLYVIYTKKREEMEFKDIFRPLDMPNYETSVITLYKPYALVDLNGVVVSSQSTLFEGTWSKSKIAELLPVDYDPGDFKYIEKPLPSFYH